MVRKVALPALLALALGVPGGAQAATPEQLSIDISESFPIEGCDTELVVTITGSVNVTLFRNSAGLVVRELDQTPASVVTFSSPETGRSFSFPNSLAATHDYGDGAQAGSTVVLTLRGLLGHVTGHIASDAGTVTLVGVVEGFDEFGVPLVDFPDPPIRETGNREPGEDIGDAFCEALGL